MIGSPELSFNKLPCSQGLIIDIEFETYFMINLLTVARLNDIKAI